MPTSKSTRELDMKKEVSNAEQEQKLRAEQATSKQKSSSEESGGYIDYNDYVGAGRAFSAFLYPSETGPKGEMLEEKIVRVGWETMWKAVSWGKERVQSVREELARMKYPSQRR